MSQDVEPAAVGHAEQDRARTVRGGVGDHLVEHGDEHAQAFDREPCLARVGAVDEALERRDFGQPIQQLAFVDRVARWAKALLFNRLQQPGTLGWVFDVGDLIAAGSAVDQFQAVDSLGGVGQVGATDSSADDRRRGMGEVILGQTVSAVVQVRIAGWLGAKWIEMCAAMAEEADTLRQRCR